LDILLRTGTALNPETQPNYLWFEEQLGKILAFGSKALIEREDPGEWIALVPELYRVLQDLGSKFLIVDALAFCHSLRDQVIEKLQDPQFASHELSQQAQDFCISASAFLFQYPTAILIGLRLGMEDLDGKFVEEIRINLLLGIQESTVVFFSHGLPSKKSRTFAKN
jgi:hypothetical protein